MLRITHMTTGLMMSATLIKEPQDYLFVGAFGLIGSLMPDIDAPNNIIRRIKYFSCVIIASLIYIYFTKIIIPFIFLLGLVIFSMKTNHRTFTHSLLGLLLFSICVYFINSRYASAFAVGYAVHLIGDSLTVMGIPVFYPYEKRFSFKLTKTGSEIDAFLCFIGFCAYVSILAH